jgi:hypothetical protein
VSAIMSRVILLVVETFEPLLIERLSADLSIWVADTATHAELKSLYVQGSDRGSITWFPLKKQESLEAAACRILAAIEEHHGAVSQGIAFDTLWIIGVPKTVALVNELNEVGIRFINETPFGLVATK